MKDAADLNPDTVSLEVHAFANLEGPLCVAILLPLANPGTLYNGVFVY